MNMRKIIAVLSAVLLLCAAIPMGVMSVTAAPGDVIIDADFNDGMDGFNNYSVVDGALVIDGAAADWANSYAYAGAIKPSTKYVVTGRAKADAPQTLNFKINNGWTNTNVSEGVALTTEWTEFELFLTPDANLVEPIFTIQTGTEASGGTTFYIDWVKVAEYEEPTVPGTIINGDFETGDLSGWEKHQSTTISTDAHNGSYAANLKGDGGWGGMLNQDVPVEAGKTYKVSVWYKVNSNGTNIQVKDGGTEGPNLASNWVTAATWTEQSWEVIPTTDILCFNFCGGGNSIAEDVLVDDITVTEVKTASFDGFITNGDFEIGEGTPWTLYGGSAVSADAAYEGDYGLICNNPTGNWNATAYQDFTVEVGKTYEVTMWAKAISQGQNIQIQNPIGTTVASEWFKKTDWTLLTFNFTATDANVRINICGGGTNGNEEVYFDNVLVSEKVEEPEGNAVIWNIDFNDGEKKFNVGEVVAEGPDGSNCYKWEFGGGYSSNYTGGPRMDFTKDYTVTMKVKGSIDSSMAITLMPGDWSTWWNGPSFTVTTEWQEVVLAIPANTVTFASGNTIFEFQGTGNEPAYTLYVDDIAISEGLPELPEQSYPINGDFETGKVAPWDNLWGSCPTVEIVEGMDGGYGLHIVSGKWLHVRQTAIPVEPNTWYKVTVWAKDTNNMHILVKDGGDSVNLLNKNASAGEEWTEISYEFNTGEYTSIIFSLMGGDLDEDGERYGTFDNISIAVAPCQHNYQLTGGEWPTCDTAGYYLYSCECGASYTEEIPAYHNGGMEYTAAVEAIDCAHPGNIEYWYCPGCNEYFADEYATEFINPWFITVTVDCVRPEGIADCATVTCETCGNEIYGYGEHDVLACQGGVCSKCEGYIEGYGCANYDTPACEDGVCYYCGGFVAGFGHENGAWAPCQDGECAYGCGLTYPATEAHVDEDANDYCDTCWNHLAHIDEDADGWCDICWNEMPVADIVYGDANGDNEIDARDIALLQQYNAGWEVTLDEVAADANGDGEIDARDIALLQQYNAGWEVTLGPDEPV